MKKLIHLLLSFLLISFISCSNEDETKSIINEDIEKSVTIFFVNDQHGQLNNFSKIKYIIDQEKKQNKNVIVACSGDMFSGNPVVDNYHNERGYPMIDVMNKVGFDVSALGNHEFDYGEYHLKRRVEDAKFKWVCANVNMLDTGIPEPHNYYTINKDGLKIIFLGLLETNGKHNATIPSTHPWRVKNISFERPENVVNNFQNLKNQENADIYIALTHLGHSKYGGQIGDFQLAERFPYFDMIIGGHSHQKIDTIVNNIPIFQAGSYLQDLGKIEITVKNKSVTNINYELINLENISESDPEIKAIIDEYNGLPGLDDVIGNSLIHHERSKVGCFYVDALKNTMNVDVSFQNLGGVRFWLDEGDITKREIYTVAPFNNQTIVYNMSVQQIKDFLIGTQSGFFFSGVQIQQIGNQIEIRDEQGNLLNNDTTLSIGLNDYIPAVYDMYFPKDGNTQSMTAAETIMFYLQNINSQVNYPNCSNYFKFNTYTIYN